jgi:Carboxypeptidase regulatory-like domain
VLRPQVKIALLTLMLTTAAIGRAADPPGAAVSGVVRDAQGIAQMGALVQVVSDGSALVGTAFTDLHGRYLILHLLPGKYEVRASAALFVPALRDNLQLGPGAQAVVNLTLNTLFETAAWLPAERRRADEPSDDWKWTLRSAANRPILRLDEDGDVLTISSSATENSKASTRASAGVIAGDGGLGNNGIHDVFSLDRVLDDGAGVTLRADIGTSATVPSTDVATGYERRLGFGGAARTVLSYQSHPELLGSDGTTGLEAVQLANAQKMQLGDMVDLQAGGTIYVVRTAGFSSASQPFVKVKVHPGESWTLGYRMATSQNLQSYEGLDSVRQQLPVAVTYQGRLQTEHGLHQEFAVGRRLGSGLVQVAYYRDSLDRVAVSGGGTLTATDLGQEGLSNASGVITDASTGDFRFLTNGYKTQGLNVVLTQPLTSSMWVAVEYSTGAALKIQPATALTLANASSDLTTEVAQSATVALKGSVVRSGTRVRAAYHWQPTRLVTAIDPYAAFSDQAYLSCYLRQAIRFGKLLPPGLDATVDITNLLAQGYHPFLSADGQTLFLAQSPRTIQAGLAFSF